MQTVSVMLTRSLLLVLAFATIAGTAFAQHSHHTTQELAFDVRSVNSGAWTDKSTWEPQQVPGKGDRVLIASGTTVEYDAKRAEVIRLVQVVGTLRFSTETDTELNVGLLTIQHNEVCSEQGFACEFEGAASGPETSADSWPSLLVGTRENPIAEGVTARIRLHALDGMSPEDAPAIACCAGRMEIHGCPLKRTWIKLGADAPVGASTVTLAEAMTDWHTGDEVLLTATERAEGSGTFRSGPDQDKEPRSEQRIVTAIEGNTLTLDRPLQFEHSGSGEFRGEVANLSRNVIVESANPAGVRGHTVYHSYSKGSIRYARFAHLGKEGILGRYPIHFHLADDTMRGSMVQGVAIVDSHNRWVTIHGTHYLVVQDCVGYQSVGHGYFLEDGTEVFNLLDRNLAVQAYRGPRLPHQALPFDPNEGAGFWWANGRNTITRNVTSENDEYGYRYDMQKRSNFDPVLSIRQADGSEQPTDVRTIPIWRFEDNEAHAEGFYGMVVAANGNDQPDSPIRDQKALKRIKTIDWTGPDIHHPHIIRKLAIWGAHYAFRPQSPAMSMEDVRIHQATYGIYRPAFENQVYRNLSISDVGSEPFNRGMDDASAQTGQISVDGLTFTTGYGNKTTPLMQISDVNISGNAATHIRNVHVHRPEQFEDRWPLLNRGVGTRVPPITSGVPVYIHDHFGPGRHAKIVSTAAEDLLQDGNDYREVAHLTSDESRAAEISDVEWPQLLDAVDDLPPATIITSLVHQDHLLTLTGISHDNGEIESIEVNAETAEVVDRSPGIVHWRVQLDIPEDGKLQAHAVDRAGNRERTGHRLALPANGQQLGLGS